MRSSLSLFTLCVATGLLGCGGGGDFDGPHGIKALHIDGYTYAYMVPVPGGVVLVDSGGDASASKLKDAVAGREILAVLLTHAHSDHAAGLSELGDVPVLMGRKEVPFLKGDEQFKGPVSRITGPVSKRPAVPSRIVPVDDGHVLNIANHTFIAVSAPGHTAGSTAWLFGDVLFTGDAAVGGNHVARSSWVFNDDTRESDEAVKVLMSLDFKWMLDGHNGQTEKSKVQSSAF